MPKPNVDCKMLPRDPVGSPRINVFTPWDCHCFTKNLNTESVVIKFIYLFIFLFIYLCALPVPDSDDFEALPLR